MAILQLKQTNQTVDQGKLVQALSSNIESLYKTGIMKHKGSSLVEFLENAFTRYDQMELS